MSHYQRDALAADCALMHEMDPDAVDVGAKVVEGIQPVLLRAPAETVRPVSEEILQVQQIRALLPWRGRGFLWPPRVPNPGAQVRDDLIAHAYGEWIGLEVRHSPSISPWP
jgi:hypothetical protein